MENYLDLDHLKSYAQSHHVRPQWFGLGFVQLKLDATRRLHFWDPTLATLVNEKELHDHRYDFTSTVLAGRLDHIVYEFSEHPDGDHQLCEVFCQPEKSAPPRVLHTGFIQETSRQTFTTGQSYHFKQGQFHQGVAAQAVTYLERGAIVSETARIIRPCAEAENWLCPFTDTLTTEQAWDAIEMILKKCATTKAA